MGIFPHYINDNLCCFFPGKVLDEIWIWIKRVRERSVQSEFYYQEMVELNDLVSMASEYFRDIVEPDVKKRKASLEQDRWTKYHKLQLDNANLTAKTSELEKVIHDKTQEISRLEGLVKHQEEDRKKISRLEDQLQEQSRLLMQLFARRKRKSEGEESPDSVKRSGLSLSQEEVISEARESEMQ